jgi:hypothetical protein
MSSNIPQGWNNQVPDRLGAIGIYRWNRNYWLPNCWRPKLLEKVDFRLSTFAGGGAGNVQRYLNAGAILAIGQPGEDFESATISTMGALLQNRSSKNECEQSAETESKAEHGLDFYARPKTYSIFVGTEQRYVFHSIFVQGAGPAAHDISLVHHVYDVFWGLSLRIYGQLSVGYKRIHRSVEFHSDDPSVVKPHNIGQFLLEYRF